MPPSTLEQHIRALCHLYAFTYARYENNITHEGLQILLADFVDAKMLGTDQFCISNLPEDIWMKKLNLGWPPISLKRTVKQYIRAINDFDDWQHKGQKNIYPLNPYETRVLTDFEKYKNFERKKKYDILLHIDSTRSHTTKDYKYDLAKNNKEHKAIDAARKQKYLKAFPLTKFADLVEKTTNIRDKMLWLLMAGTGLRLSECLNLFFTDVIGRQDDGSAAIMLAHPQVGMTTWTDQSGTYHHSTREDYIKTVYKNIHLPEISPLYNLLPRTLYTNSNSGLWAGWKGSTIHFRDTDRILFPGNDPQQHRPYEIYVLPWMHPTIGRYFYKLYQEYQQTCYWYNRTTGAPEYCNKLHPWLFINISGPFYGHPLQRKNAYKAFTKALANINMGDHNLGPHSLRHLYAFVHANNSALDKTDTQGLLRHASIDSTEVYYHKTHSQVREEIYSQINPNHTKTGKKLDFNLPQYWNAL